MNLRNPIKPVTNYNFKVYRNGILRQEIDTHNIICDIFYVARPDYRNCTKLSYCPIVVGNGMDVVPAATDRRLKSQLWRLNCDSSVKTYHLRENEDDVEWCQLTNKYTIPATTSYVGTITECGLWGVSNECLTTHALLLDAEGNPISIEKTDLDLVIIEVSIRFYFNNTEAIKTVPAHLTPIMNNFHRYYNSSSTPLCECLNENIEALWSLRDPIAGNDMVPWGTARPKYFSTYLSTLLVRNTDTSSSTSRPVGEIHVQGARLGVDFTNPGQHFIKGFRVANMFIIPLPNEDIFPRYEIKDMEVGVGDGETTEFVCPMNYFIQDTDKVYVDGILQTRGVDYTLECDNNNQMLPELMASNDAIMTGPRSTDEDRGVYLPVFRAALTIPKCFDYRSGANPSNHIIDFDSSNPIFFDMEKEVKVNTFQIGKGYNYSNSGVVYKLWASDDGEIYTEIASITRTTRDAISRVTFDTVFKRYFKVTVSTKSNSVYVSYDEHVENPTMPRAVDKGNLCLFGYVGHGIQFTNPPAADAIITMDASTDLPMKNENFVFDVNMKLTYL